MSKSTHSRIFAVLWAFSNSTFALAAFLISGYASITSQILFFNLFALLVCLIAISVNIENVKPYLTKVKYSIFLFAFGAGILNILMDVFFLSSLKGGNPAVSYLLFSSWPLWYHVANMLIEGKRESAFKKQVIATMLGFSGVIAVLAGTNGTAILSDAKAPEVLALLGAICAGGYNPLVVRFLNDLSNGNHVHVKQTEGGTAALSVGQEVAKSSIAVAVVSITGTIFALVYALIDRRETLDLYQNGHAVWLLGALYIGTVIYGFGQLFSFLAQQRRHDVNIATIAYVSPVLSIVWLAIAQDIQVTPIVALGAIVILFSTFVSQNDLISIPSEAGAIFVMGAALAINVLVKNDTHEIVSFETAGVLVGAFGILAGLLASDANSRRQSLSIMLLKFYRNLEMANVRADCYPLVERELVKNTAARCKSLLQNLILVDGRDQRQRFMLQIVNEVEKCAQAKQIISTDSAASIKSLLDEADQVSSVLHAGNTAALAAFYLMAAMTTIIMMFSGHGNVFDGTISVAFSSAVALFTLSVRDSLAADLTWTRNTIELAEHPNGLDLASPNPVGHRDFGEGWLFIGALAIAFLIMQLIFQR